MLIIKKEIHVSKLITLELKIFLIKKKFNTCASDSLVMFGVK